METLTRDEYENLAEALKQYYSLVKYDPFAKEEEIKARLEIVERLQDKIKNIKINEN